jgi:predicted phage tail protein
MYNAGMSIAVLAQAGQPIVTRVGFNANQFVLMSGSGDTQYSPFAVVNGQVFISSAFIQDGTITNAKIGNSSSPITMSRVLRDGVWIKTVLLKLTVLLAAGG